MQYHHGHAPVPYAPEPRPAVTMVGVLDESAAARPYRAFLFFRGARMTYDVFVRKSDSLAAALVALGVRPGERVAMLLPNSPQAMLGFQAIWKAGAVACPIDPLLSWVEIEQALIMSGACAAIALNTLYETVKKVQPAGLRFVIATGNQDFLPFPTRTAYMLVSKKKECGRIALKTGDYRLGDLLNRFSGYNRPQLFINPGDAAVLLFSRGAPGGITGTHQALVATALKMRGWLGAALEEWEDRMALILPPSHILSSVAAVGTALVNHSSCVLVQVHCSPYDAIRGIKKYKADFILATSAFYNAIMNYQPLASGRVSLKNLNLCIAGAAPLTSDAKDRFERATGGSLLDGYAMTAIMQGDGWMNTNDARWLSEEGGLFTQGGKNDIISDGVSPGIQAGYIKGG